MLSVFKESLKCIFCGTVFSRRCFLLVWSIWCLICSSNFLCSSIKDTNPAESKAITEQVEYMERLLVNLKLETQRKRDLLQQAQNQQSFLQDSRRLLLWAEGIREKLRSEEMGVDVASAEQLLREHQDLLKEIRSQKER